MLLILFGLLGSGKNFVGELLRDDYGMTFYDADTDLPPEMREAILRREVVSNDVRDRFFDIVVRRLGELSQQGTPLVGAQALYKEKHRQLLQRAFPRARFILVQTTPELLEVRLNGRNDRFVDLDYARKIAPLFEAPRLPYFVITNNAGKPELKLQLDRLLEAIATSI